jgi:precorrin-6Y C5,15-methyltransferase (decarboxylating)
MHNTSFTRGSIQYVGSEIRAVILNKMHLALGDTVIIVSGESIAVESAMLAPEGTIIAVEYNKMDRKTMEENVHHFGLNNITIIDRVDEETMSKVPVPTLAFIVASASLEKEIQCLLQVNPNMEFVVYTLDFRCAATLPGLFEQYGIGETETIQIAVSRLNAKNNLVTEQAPWIISGRAGV